MENDLRQIRDFYNGAIPGLGEQFLEEFEKHIQVISRNPKRWMVIADEIRRSLMRRFPYVVYFRLSAPDTIRITVVKHHRRRPSLGRERR